MYSLDQPFVANLSKTEIIKKLEEVDDMRLFLLAEAIRKGISNNEIFEITKVDKFFLSKIRNIVNEEEKLKLLKISDLSKTYLRKLKKMGFADREIARFTN